MRVKEKMIIQIKVFITQIQIIRKRYNHTLLLLNRRPRVQYTVGAVYRE